MNHHSMKLLGIVLLVATFLAGGCASVPMASPEDDAHAKAAVVPPGKSLIYVYRNETLGSAVEMTVLLDNKEVGKSGPRTYFMFEVEPGEHEIASRSENTSIVLVKAVAGKAYYLWQEVKMGAWKARTLLQQVDEATGRAGVAECQRAQSL